MWGNFFNWRDVKPRRDRQTSIEQWLRPVPVVEHDHRLDFLWEEDGLPPPCKTGPDEVGP